jgi:pyruvate-formate lyase-activating enzyme
MLPVLSDNGVFCALPWVHQCASVDGVWSRCCVDSTMYYDELYKMPERPEFRLRPDSVGCLPHSAYASANPEKTFNILEAFNSPVMRKTRLSMLSGKEVKACQYCYDREASGATSYRQLANQMFTEQADLQSLIEKTTADGSLDEFPCYLDLRFGNTCNLACIMCGFPVSSKWGAKAELKWLPLHIDPYKSDTELWRMLQVNAHKLRRIYFAGGEPFLQRSHFKLLDLLIEGNLAAGIDLAYNTNLTILPKGIFEKLGKFRSVDIGASCDGTGALFEAIRVGAKWDTFVKNVRKTKQYFQVRLAVTPQKQNIDHLQPIIEWAISENCQVDLKNILMYPEELSLNALGNQAKKLFAAEYSQLSNHYREKGHEKIANELANVVQFLKQSFRKG